MNLRIVCLECMQSNAMQNSYWVFLCHIRVYLPDGLHYLGQIKRSLEDIRILVKLVGIDAGNVGHEKERRAALLASY